MSNKINKPLCATQFGNVGFGDCIFDPGKIKGAIQVPSSFSITESQIAGLRLILVNATHAAIGSRIFPYHNFATVTDNTEDVSITTTDYGYKYITKEGFYDWTFRYFSGGVGLHQQVKKNSGPGKYFLFYDDNGTLIGYKSNGLLKGVPVDQFYVNPWKLNTGADAASYTMRFILDSRYLNGGNMGYIPLSGSFNLFDIVGLQELSIELVSLVSNAATVKLFTKISGVDMYDAYSSNFNQAAAWQFTNEDGIAGTITSVALDAANKGWVITLNSSQFINSDKIYLYTAAAATLKAAPISVTGFEGSEGLTVEAPQSS